jgi:hypothetical protein
MNIVFLLKIFEMKLERFLILRLAFYSKKYYKNNI